MLIDECYKEAEILQNEANYNFDEVSEWIANKLSQIDNEIKNLISQAEDN